VPNKPAEKRSPGVLIVEDSPTQAEQLRQLLEHDGFSVEVARNGAEGLRSAQNKRPDIVISDIVMPEMDGYAFCTAFKANDALKDIPVMLVTTLADPREVIRALECGADNFVTKPYDEQYLVTRVNYLLANKALRGSSKFRTGIEVDLLGTRHFITAERHQILDLLVSSFAAAVRMSEETSARERSIRESHANVQVLQRNAEDLNKAYSEDDVVKATLKACTAFPFLEGGRIRLIDDQGGTYRSQATDLGSVLSNSLESLTGDDSAAAAASDRSTAPGHIVVVHWQNLPEPAKSAQRDHALVWLSGQTQRHGCLGVVRASDGPFSDTECQILATVGNQVTFALDRVRANEDLERLVDERTRQLREEIAERKSAEIALNETLERLHRAQHVGKLGSGEIDLRTGAVIWSSNFMYLLGLQAAGAPTIEALERSIHPDDRDRVGEVTRHNLAGRETEPIEFRIVVGQDKIKWVRRASAVKHDSSGEAIGLVVTYSDITETKLIEDQLRQSQKMEALGNLTGGIAHDFNNILAIILTNLELVQLTAGGDADEKEMIDAAISACEKGSALTRSLLAFSRRQPLDPKPIRLNELLSDWLKLVRRAIGEDIEVSLSTADNLGLINVDQAQLESALLNMLVNARDAMPKGGHVIIETSNVNIDQAYADANYDMAPGGYVLLSVSDNGHGMPPEVVARVFEPFFTTKPKGRGTGLGLAMVFGFVKQSGGHIKIYSEVGHGTTIRIYLPRAEAAGSQRTGDAFDTVAHRAAASETILVVEDNIDVRRAVVRLLRHQGYRVIETDQVAGAIEALEAEPAIDLVLSDIVMPGGRTGIDLAEEIRARWPNVQIILTSGFSESLLKNGKNLPNNVSLINKPYRKDDLFRTLRKVLKG
jgi:signal transduction histidine kinase/DNA-binding response OmpR family regulator